MKDSLIRLFQEVRQDTLMYYIIPIFIGSILIEAFISYKRSMRLYEKKDTYTSISVGFLSLIVEFTPKIIAFIFFVYLHSISPLKDVVHRQWWAWILLLFADDFSYYWFHRLNHEVRLFWAGHVSHHSSIKLNLGTALRQGVGERLHKYIYWAWIPLIGFDPLMILTMMTVNLLYQFFTHIDWMGKLPKPIEFIFNTPSHHRVHHASNIRYLDRNHAGIFIIWDRLFGTFAEEKADEKPVYGLTKNIHSHNPLTVATHEYKAIWTDVKRAKKWSDKLKYIFYAPGWSHDGEDLRARVLRNQSND